MPNKRLPAPAYNPPNTISERMLAIKSIVDSEFYEVRYAFSTYILLRAYLSSLSVHFLKKVEAPLLSFLTEIMPKIIFKLFAHFKEYKKYEEVAQNIYIEWQTLREQYPPEVLMGLPDFYRLGISAKEEESWKGFMRFLDTDQTTEQRQNQSLMSLDFSIASSQYVENDRSISDKLAITLKLYVQLKRIYGFLTKDENTLLEITKALNACVDIILMHYSHEIGFTKLLHNQATAYQKLKGLKLKSLKEGEKEPSLNDVLGIKVTDSNAFHQVSQAIKTVDSGSIEDTHFYQSFIILENAIGGAHLNTWSKRILEKTQSYSTQSMQTLIAEIATNYNFIQHFRYIASTSSYYPEKIYYFFVKIINCLNLYQLNFSSLSSENKIAWINSFNHSDSNSEIPILLKEGQEIRGKSERFFSSANSEKLYTTLNKALKLEDIDLRLDQLLKPLNSENYFSSTSSSQHALPTPRGMLGFSLIKLCAEFEQACYSMKPIILTADLNGVGLKCFKEIGDSFKLLQIQLTQKIVNQLTEVKRITTDSSKNNKTNAASFSLVDYVKAIMKDYNSEIMRSSNNTEWKSYQSAFNKIQRGIARNKDDGYFQALIEKNFDDSSDLALSPNPTTTSFVAIRPNTNKTHTPSTSPHAKRPRR